MIKFVILLLCTALIACQGATTAKPKLSKQEIIDVRHEHEEFITQSKYQAPKDKVKITPQMSARFKEISKKIGFAGQQLCEEIGKKTCNFNIELAEDENLNAFADGKKVVISSAMADFATNDYELANVIAHEYAHNIMEHVSKSTQNAIIGSIIGLALDAAVASQGIDSGGLGQNLGQTISVLRYSPSFEHEADYVGLYILARSGYDISKTPIFWRKMSAIDKNGIYTRTTHPTNPERYLALSKSIEEINSKKAAKVNLLPEFIKGE